MIKAKGREKRTYELRGGVNYPNCTTVNPIYEIAGHERTTRGACDEKECVSWLIAGGKAELVCSNVMRRNEDSG